MTKLQRGWFWKAVAFALVYEMIVLLLGWLLFDIPQHDPAQGGMQLTLTIGLPMIAQVLGSHQHLNVATVLWGIFSTILFSFANGLYISRLARSVRDLDGTPLSDAKRATVWLLIWLLIQAALGIASIPLIHINSLLGGAASVILLLTLRYWYLLLEYAIVVGGYTLREAWNLAPQLRVLTFGGAPRYFWLVMIFNITLSYLANAWYSLPNLFLFMLLNALVISWLQHRLLKQFFRAFDDLNLSAPTGIVSL